METLVLRVAGMSCAGCEQRITRVLDRVEGVREVSADHTSGRVHIRLDPQATDRGVLTERIEAAGFAVVEEGDR
jgi:copper chaperone